VARRLPPTSWVRQPGQTDAMLRAVAISRDTVGSRGLYSSIVTTAPGGRTRVHHHGPCETSIYILSGRARFTWGPTGVEETMEAEPGDVVYIAAEEVHVEENASTSQPLVVLVTRNCAEGVNVYRDDS
jgi:uncharacterized RmlC-like cupin family protein